jgi:hypothetical protein
MGKPAFFLQFFLCQSDIPAKLPILADQFGPESGNVSPGWLDLTHKPEMMRIRQ